MPRPNLTRSLLSRRGFLGRVGGAGLMGLFGTSAWTAMAATLEPFVNGRRDLVTHFPTKTRWKRTFRLIRGYPLQ